MKRQSCAPILAALLATIVVCPAQEGRNTTPSDYYYPVEKTHEENTCFQRDDYRTFRLSVGVMPGAKNVMLTDRTAQFDVDSTSYEIKTSRSTFIELGTQSVHFQPLGHFGFGTYAAFSYHRVRGLESNVIHHRAASYGVTVGFDVAARVSAGFPLFVTLGPRGNLGMAVHKSEPYGNAGSGWAYALAGQIGLFVPFETITLGIEAGSMTWVSEGRYHDGLFLNEQLSGRGAYYDVVIGYNY